MQQTQPPVILTNTPSAARGGKAEARKRTQFAARLSPLSFRWLPTGRPGSATLVRA